MFKKLQFIHTVNGTGKKTAIIIKGTINHTNIDTQAMLVWLIVSFMIFAVFNPSPLTVCINCSFWATVCKTVRPMLSVRCLLSCSVLSVTFVHCDQTVARIKMKLGVQVSALATLC